MRLKARLEQLERRARPKDDVGIYLKTEDPTGEYVLVAGAWRRLEDATPYLAERAFIIVFDGDASECEAYRRKELERAAR